MNAEMKPACIESKPQIRQLQRGAHGQGNRRRLLAICTVDVMAWKLLHPWLGALMEAGIEVHLACARGPWFDQLAGAGYHMHAVPLRRRINPLVHIAPLWAIYQLIRRERFAVVNTHSPVAATVGRLAAWFAHVPVISYTVHGFYFHDDMPWWKRSGFVALEKWLGRFTDGFPTKIVRQRCGKTSPARRRPRSPFTTEWTWRPIGPGALLAPVPRNCGAR